MALVSLKNYDINVDLIPNLFPHDVVFLHGNLASNTWWQPAMAAWRADAAKLESHAVGLPGRAILVEWRGCGKSNGPTSAPRTNADLEPQQLANDLIELTEVLGLKQFDLVGHSLGGLIALMATLGHQDRVSKLVLLDSVGAKGVQFPKEGRDAFLQMKADRSFCEAVMASTIRGCDVNSHYFKQIIDDTMSISPLIWTAIPEVLASVNIVDQLHGLKNPTLVIHGDQDPILPKSDSIALADKIQNAKYIELKDHGHSPNVESPQLFAKIVNEFLFDA